MEGSSWMSRRRRQSKKRRSLTPWRENLECLAAAIVMALVLKYFVIEAYKIPTGSMQPTLMGDAGTQIFDRILVDKLSYRYRDPLRWEIAVFKYPLDLSKNYVKRIVGMPLETLAVADGNLWSSPEAQASAVDMTGSWKIQRKPVEIQGDLWKKIYEWDDPGRRPESIRTYNTATKSDTVQVTRGEWQPDARGLVTSGETFRMIFPDGGKSVMDYYRHGYPAEIMRAISAPEHDDSPLTWLGKNQVGDLKLATTVTPHADLERLDLIIRSYTRIHLFSVSGPAGKGAASITWNALLDRLPAQQNPTAEKPFVLEAGRTYDIEADNCDQRLRLVIDGEELLSVEHGTPRMMERRVAQLDIPGNGGEDHRALSDPTCRAEIFVPSGKAHFERIAVSRDIHYTPERNQAGVNRPEPDWANGFQLLTRGLIPEKCYFMMGDNTQNSLDSRGWELIEGIEVGTGESVEGNYNRTHVPGSNEANPRAARDGQTMVLRDVSGFQRLIEPDAGNWGTGFAPYVRREYIVGKAFLVFWPMRPFAPVSSVKFIR